jgi:hypothetical protein
MIIMVDSRITQKLLPAFAFSSDIDFEAEPDTDFGADAGQWLDNIP